MTVGGQEWTAENLRSTTYADGTPVDAANIGYPAANEANTATYGLMYNWPGAMRDSVSEGAQGICPDGWHIPSKPDFEALLAFLQSEGHAPGAAIYSADHGGTDAYGLDGRPNGILDGNGAPHNFGNGFEIWTSTDIAGHLTNWFWIFGAGNPTIGGGYESYYLGVRCVKD